MRKLLFILLLCLITSPAFGQYFMPNQKPMLGLQVNWAHPLSKGLVGYWLSNEGSGNIVSDLSGKENNGILSSSGATWTSGLHGHALSFDGVNGEAILSDATRLNTGGGEVTFCIWLKFNAIESENCHLIGNYSGSGAAGKYVDIYLTSSNVLFVATDDGVDLVTQGGYSPSTGVWYFLAGVVSQSKGIQQLYVNGQPYGNNVTPRPGSLLSPDPVYIANDQGRVLEPANITVSLAFMYLRALSASEIALLYREPFCIMQGELSIAMMYAEEAPPTGGQVIMIQMTAIPLAAILSITLALVFSRRRK